MKIERMRFTGKCMEPDADGVYVFYENAKGILDEKDRELERWKASTKKEAAKACALQDTEAKLTADNRRLRDIVDRLIEWNRKYPSNRIYNHHIITRIAEEMDCIYKQAITQGGEGIDNENSI